MTDTTHETHEMELQLLTAQDGTAYLLPRALVEAARLTPEEAAAFAEAVAERSGDVRGYSSSVQGSLSMLIAPSAPSALPPGALSTFNTVLTAITSMTGYTPLGSPTGGAPMAPITGSATAYNSP